MHDHLHEARTHRAGIRDAIGRVERSLASPAVSRYEPWAKELADELEDLDGALERHIETTEAPGGLLDDILHESPRLAHRVSVLRDDHQRLRELLAEARASLPRSADDVPEAREHALALLQAVSRHRHLGADLVYEAYHVDLEGGE
jgi:uncharacterized membrane protein YccC